MSLSDYSSANIIYRYFAVVEDKAEQGAKISRIQYLLLKRISIKEQENENGENSEESILGQEEK